MQFLGKILLGASAALFVCSPLMAAPKKRDAREVQQKPSAFDPIADKFCAREADFVKQLKDYSPMVETYIQNMRPDKDLGSIPVSDNYFLGRVKLERGVNDTSFKASDNDDQKHGFLHKVFAPMTSITHVNPWHGSRYMPEGFAQMILIDQNNFNRQHYDFKFVRREFLGDVRTIVVDVQPKPHQKRAMFQGRVWVEDQRYNVVRFNGVYTPNPAKGVYLHFDSWRTNMVGDQWLPTYIYSEETDLKRGHNKWDFRAQTRLWGYDVLRPSKQSEFTDIVVDSPDQVKDQSESKADLSPVEARRAWERQAEDNVIERLQRAGLVAPEGDVDKVLATVVQNIEVTNNLDVQPEIRCRVLLTYPIESFTVGHTIVVSRGLLDALPDEASLAAVLAHEMGHIVSTHTLNTKYAFNDRLIFPDEKTFSKVKVARNEAEEKEADTRGLALLQNSPYKDKLQAPGLFLAALKAESTQLPNLLDAHFGNPMAASTKSKKGGEIRMGQLMNGAPQLQPTDVKQIAALPLGGRIKVDPWTDRVEMQKNRSVALLSAREKMPFQVTPMFPYLTRQGAAAANQNSNPQGQPQPTAADPANTQPVHTAPTNTASKVDQQQR